MKQPDMSTPIKTVLYFLCVLLLCSACRRTSHPLSPEQKPRYIAQQANTKADSEKPVKSLQLPDIFFTKHNPVGLCLLREAIKRSHSISDRQLTPAVRTILTRLLSVVQFVEKDKHFHAIFPEYVRFLAHLHRQEDGQVIGSIAAVLLRSAFQRAQPRLQDIFEATLKDKWRFASLLPLLDPYKLPRQPYLTFYQTRFPKGGKKPKISMLARLLQQKKYHKLGLQAILALQASRKRQPSARPQKPANSKWVTASSCQQLRQLPPKFLSRQNQAEVCLLREAIQRSNVKVERALLKGLHWLLQVVEQDTSFDEIFVEYVLLLDQLQQAHRSHPIGYLARQLLLNAFQRARPHLADIFDPTLDDKLRFRSILPLLARYKIPRQEYLRFFQTRFPKSKSSSKESGLAQALQQNEKGLKLSRNKTIAKLLSHQHAVGSWGKDADFTEGIDTATRPTIASLRVLSSYLMYTHAAAPSTKPRATSWLQQSVCVRSKDLPPAFRTRQSPTAMCLVQEAIPRTASPLERGALAGLHWLIQEVEQDAAYFDVFDHHVNLLDHLNTYGKHTAVAVVARRLLHDAFRRAKARLDEIFSQSVQGKRRFLRILPLLTKYNIPQAPYRKFYKTLSSYKLRIPSRAIFVQAVKQRKFERLGDYMMDEVFLYHMKKSAPSFAKDLPPGKILMYLQEANKLPLTYTFDQNPNRYTEQSLFVGQVLLAAHQTGIQSSANIPVIRKFQQYLLKQFATIHTQVNDIDLLAVTVQALSTFPRGQQQNLGAARKHLLSLQHTDGSWGKDEDLQQKDTYKKLLPTWSVLQALTTRSRPTTRAATTRLAWPQGSRCIRPPGLPPAFRSKYNPKEVRLLREAIRKTHSKVERALLAGMHWLVWVMEKEANFEEGFGDYTTLMNEMAIYGKGTTPGIIAKRLLRNAFLRAVTRLPKIFDPNLTDKGDFITTLYMLYKLDIPKAPFIKFYKQYFPPGQPVPAKITFDEAFKKRDYDTMGTHIIDEAFLDAFQLQHPNNPFNLRKSQLPRYVQMMEKLPFIYDKNNFHGYNSQNYFVTHIVLAINHYGESPLPNTPLTRRILKYLDQHFANVRYHVKDLDLLAEFVYCYKIYGLGERADVKEAIQYMLDLQHEDGSWGTDSDFRGTLYQYIHPTWAVITGLVDIKSQLSGTTATTSKPTTRPTTQPISRKR